MLELPEVAGPGYAPADDVEPTVIATTHRILVEGASVANVRDGAIDPSDKSPGGLEIPRLTAMGGKLAKRQAPPLYVAIDRGLTYGVLIEILFSLKKPESGWKSFALLAKHGDRTLSVPLVLPDRSRPTVVVDTVAAKDERKVVEALAALRPHRSGFESSGVALRGVGDRGDRDQPVKLVVTMTSRDIVVWSFSGVEGTLTQPKLSVARTDPSAMSNVNATLAEIIRRRWPGQRPETTREIVVMAERATPMQLVAEVLGAVRALPDGTALFPDILLSTGFE